MMGIRGLLILIIAPIVAIGCSQSVDQTQIEDAVRSALQDGNLVGDRYTARSFELVDENGAVRATLGMHDGVIGLALRDERGVTRITVGFDDRSNPSITLYDEAGTRRAGLEFALGISPSLFLRDTNGTLKAGFQVQGDGGPTLFLRGSQGENGFAVAIIGDDQPVLSLAEPGGRHRVFLGLEDEGFNPSLVFLDESGEPIAAYP